MRHHQGPERVIGMITHTREDSTPLAGCTHGTHPDAT